MEAIVLKPILDLLEQLPWLDKVEGLVRAVRVDLPTEQGRVSKTIPLLCTDTPQACLEEGREIDLLPNDHYSSLAFFESAGAITYQGLDEGNRFATWQIPVRLLVWLNLHKLGIDSCAGSGLLALSLASLLTGNHKGGWPGRLQYQNGFFPLNNIDLPGAGVEVEITGINTSQNNPFSAYTAYPETFFFPYAAFSISLNLKLLIGKNCIELFEPGQAIVC